MVELRARTAQPRGPTWNHALRPLAGLAVATALTAPAAADPRHHRDRDQDADARAAQLVAQLTLDEKLQLVHGWGVCGIPIGGPTDGNRGAGFIPGVPRLGIPDFNSNDGPAGPGNCAGRANGAGTVLDRKSVV